VNLLNTGELPGAEENNPRMVRSSNLYDDAKNYSARNRYLTETQLGLFLRKMGCEHHHNAKFRAWIFPPLAVARKRWITNVGGNWDWLSAAKDWNDKASILETAMKSAKKPFGPR
jgi:hypothetical protein